MSLSDTTCKSAKPKEKPYKLADSGGLYLEIMPNGSKLWRVKYRYMKKEKRLSLGAYPLTGLSEARKGRDAAKIKLKQNIDPSNARRDGRKQAERDAANTFMPLALEWHEKQKERLSERYHAEVLHNLEKDVFPFIGTRPISKLEAPDILEVLTKIENRGAYDIARRIRNLCSQVFQYGVNAGKCKYNPARDLQGALTARKRKHFAALEPSEIPDLLMALDKNDARLFARTRHAIKLSMLTFVRPGEIRQAVWDEFDFDKKEWLIPAERMKSRKAHIVPLSKQSISILEEQKEETGHFKSGYVFPGQNNQSRPMSENTVCVALVKLGFQGRMTAHGFRALARTTIREELDYAPDIIEIQLAHRPAGPLGAAYDRSKFIKKRYEMMQKWADYLDEVLDKEKKKRS